MLDSGEGAGRLITAPGHRDEFADEDLAIPMPKPFAHLDCLRLRAGPVQVLLPNYGAAGIVACICVPFCDHDIHFSWQVHSYAAFI